MFPEILSIVTDEATPLPIGTPTLFSSPKIATLSPLSAKSSKKVQFSECGDSQVGDVFTAWSERQKERMEKFEKLRLLPHKKLQEMPSNINPCLLHKKKDKIYFLGAQPALYGIYKEFQYQMECLGYDFHLVIYPSYCSADELTNELKIWFDKELDWNARNPLVGKQYLIGHNWGAYHAAALADQLSFDKVILLYPFLMQPRSLAIDVNWRFFGSMFFQMWHYILPGIMIFVSWLVSWVLEVEQASDEEVWFLSRTVPLHVNKYILQFSTFSHGYRMISKSNEHRSKNKINLPTDKVMLYTSHGDPHTPDCVADCFRMSGAHVRFVRDNTDHSFWNHPEWFDSTAECLRRDLCHYARNSYDSSSDMSVDACGSPVLIKRRANFLQHSRSLPETLEEACDAGTKAEKQLQDQYEIRTYTLQHYTPLEKDNCTPMSVSTMDATPPYQLLGERTKDIDSFLIGEMGAHGATDTISPNDSISHSSTRKYIMSSSPDSETSLDLETESLPPSEHDDFDSLLLAPLPNPNESCRSVSSFVDGAFREIRDGLRAPLPTPASFRAVSSELGSEHF